MRAELLDMRFEQALAHLQLGRHAGADEGRARHHLDKAHQLLTEMRLP